MFNNFNKLDSYIYHTRFVREHLFHWTQLFTLFKLNQFELYYYTKIIINNI